MLNNKVSYINQKIYSIPSTNEWQNSLYIFNKNLCFETNIKDKLVNQIINSYFNSKPDSLINVKFFNKDFKSLNRIFTSLHIKHTINEIYITIYSFNKEKSYFLNKLNKWFSNLYIKKHKIWYSDFVLQNIKFKNTIFKYKKNNDQNKKKEFKLNIYNRKRAILNFNKLKGIFKIFNLKKLKRRLKNKVILKKYNFLLNKFKFKKFSNFINKGINSKNFLKNLKSEKYNIFMLNFINLYCYYIFREK